MPDDQATPSEGSGLTVDSFLGATDESEQPAAEVEEQSYEQTDEGTSEETSEESVEDQLRAQLEQANTNTADIQTKLDAMNRTFTQQHQEQAAQRKQEEVQAQQVDYSQYPEETRAAVQELDRRIDERAQQIVEAKFGSLNEQVQGLTEQQKQDINIATAIRNNPGVTKEAIMAMYSDSNLTTEDIIARAIAGKGAAKAATAKVKKDLTRKKGANTGAGKGGSPNGKDLPFVYDSKNPEHVAMGVPEIMRRSKGESG